MCGYKTSLVLNFRANDHLAPRDGLIQAIRLVRWVVDHEECLLPTKSILFIHYYSFNNGVLSAKRATYTDISCNTVQMLPVTHSL